MSLRNRLAHVLMFVASTTACVGIFASELEVSTLTQRNGKGVEFRGDGVSLLVQSDGVSSTKLTIGYRGTSRTVEHPATFLDEFRKARRFGSSLVLISGVGHYSGLSNFLVLDLETLSVVRCFNAFRASLSPDNTRVAYVRFYPLHFAELPEDQYYLESLTTLPAINGATDVTKDTPIDPFAPSGVRIATLSNSSGYRPNTGIPAEKAHRLLSDIQWSPDGASFGFVEGVGRGGVAVVTALLDVAQIRVNRFGLAQISSAHSRYEVDLQSTGAPQVFEVVTLVNGEKSRKLLRLETPTKVLQSQ